MITSRTIIDTCPSKSIRRSGVKKKFLPLLATIIITATALLPLGIPKAQAVSYYPTYSCYYRDIAGSCLSYQTSNPYHLTSKRLRHPFRNFRYEKKNHNYYNYHNNKNKRNGEWRNYYDEDDDTVRSYRYQTGNEYYDYDDDDDNHWYNDNDDEYIHFEFESTRTYCTGRDCRSYNRY
jgi:hypothetical protein